MRGHNTINGREGRLFLDGEEMAHIKSLEASIEKNKEEIAIMGRRWMGHKSSSLKGSGTMTFYKVTSQFQKVMMEYSKSGEDAFFTLQAVLDDPGAQRGTERVTLYDVNIDSIKIAQLDVDTAALEEEVPFTFEGAELSEELSDSF